jgi:hypothetical protein
VTRRQAKKRIRRKWHIKRGDWPRDISPRDVDAVYTFVTRELANEFGKLLDRAILYGSGDGGLHCESF